MFTLVIKVGFELGRQFQGDGQEQLDRSEARWRKKLDEIRAAT
jgi:hypothetical protein